MALDFKNLLGAADSGGIAGTATQSAMGIDGGCASPKLEDITQYFQFALTVLLVSNYVTFRRRLTPQLVRPRWGISLSIPPYMQAFRLSR